MTIGLMAGMGLAKSELIDRPREERQRQQAANTMRYSPWTGMAPNAIQEADPLGSAMESGLTGAMLSQNQQKLDAAKAKDIAEIPLTGGTSPIGPYKTAEEYPLALAPMEQMQPSVAGPSPYSPQAGGQMALQPMQFPFMQMGPQPMQPMRLASR
jgi:hypothetical protein